jgi:hypothetical protein
MASGLLQGEGGDAAAVEEAGQQPRLLVRVAAGEQQFDSHRGRQERGGGQGAAHLLGDEPGRHIAEAEAALGGRHLGRGETGFDQLAPYAEVEARRIP